MLEQETRYYDEHISEWLTRFPGRFVVVKGSELVGAYDTVEEALAEGTRRFGLSSFLVRRVEQVPPEVTVPALTFGVLNASIQRPVSGSGTDA